MSAVARQEPGPPIGFLYAAVATGVGIVTAFPAVAPFIARDLGATPTAMAWAFAGHGVGMVMAAPVIPAILRRIGPAWTAVGSSMVLAVAAWLHVASPSTGVLVAARVLAGMADTGVLVGAVAWISAGAAGSAHRLIAAMAPVVTAASVVAPLVAGLLLARVGARSVFGLTALVACLASVGLLRSGRRGSGHERPSEGPPRSSFLRRSGVGMPAALSLFLVAGMAESATGLAGPFHLDVLGWGTRAGWLLAASGALAAGTAWWGSRDDRRIAWSVGQGGALALAVAMVPAIVSIAPWSVGASLLLRGLGLGVLYTIALPLLTHGSKNTASPTGPTRGAAIAAVCFGVAETIGPLLAAGALAVADRGPYFMVAGVAIAAAILVGRHRRHGEPVRSDDGHGRSTRMYFINNTKS